MIDSLAQPAAPDIDHHVPNLAHHFDTQKQQYEAARLGMWLFLATELLLFGGLFCLYAIFRGNHPEMFQYGSRFLDTNWGAINTVVLILSSLTMAIAVLCAQTGRQKYQAFFLLLTLLLAGDFLLIKYLEYSHKFQERLVWGIGFYETPAGYTPPAPEPEQTAAPDNSSEAAEVAKTPVEIGRDLWNITCRSCHGPRGAGITGQGKDMRGSEFIQDRTDAELVDFIKVGRMPFDPMNTTGIQMPPRGGNPMLQDDDLFNILRYLRTFEGVGDGSNAPAAPIAEDEEFWIPASSIPPASAGPPGLALAALEAIEGNGPAIEPATTLRVHHTLDPDRPANAHLFFSIYFLMTGLHGFHVLAGMVLITWLLIKTLRGQFNRQYYTPVDLGGLYWHVVDVIWIFLFPLFYLIG